MKNISNGGNPQSVTGCINPVPIGFSLCWMIVVDYRKVWPIVSVNLQIACNDGDTITLLP